MHRLLFIQFIFLLASLKLAAGNTPAEGVAANNNLRGSGMNFIENKGQIADMNNNIRRDILFAGEAKGMQVYLRNGGISYVLTKYNQEFKSESQEKQIDISEKLNMAKNEPTTIQLHRVDLDFVDCNPNASVVRNEQVEGYSNYYYAYCPGGITQVRSFNKIVYQNVYPNIDIVFYGEKENGLKYDIIVKSGGDPNDIKLRYVGAEELRIESASGGSELRIAHSLGEITEELPRVYQNINGKIVDVKAEYELEGTTLNFKLGTFNSREALVIDPWASWITYYGGSGDDMSKNIACDQSGDVVMVGQTGSTNFPVSPGAFQTTFTVPTPWAKHDLFISKFDKNGARLWATYYSGSDDDYCNDVAVDNSGNTYVTGATMSGDFPVTTGVLKTNATGTYQDAFLIKFGPTGNRIFAFFHGGTGIDIGRGIAADAAGNIMMAGITMSTDLPVTSSAFQSSFKNSGTIPSNPRNGFITRFDATGTIIWSTYYGGGYDVAVDVVIDGNNDIIAAGTTRDNSLGTAGVAQPTLSPGTGEEDCYVVKFNSSGTRLWHTYYGGVNGNSFGGSEVVNNLCFDSSNNIIFSGLAKKGFPVSPGMFQVPSTIAGLHPFLVKMAPNGTRIWATQYNQSPAYIDTWNTAKSAVDRFDNIYLFSEYEDQGPTNSFSCGFQKNNAGGPTNGYEDQYIIKFSPLGKIICGTYLGGPMEDDLDYPTSGGFGDYPYSSGGGGIACYDGFIYISAVSRGGSYPVTSSAFQTNYGGAMDATLAKICALSCGDPTPLNIQAQASQNNICPNIPVNFSSSWFSCAGDTADYTYQWTFTGASVTGSTIKNPIGISYPAPGSYDVKLVMHTPCGYDSIVKPNYITITPCGLNVLASGQSVCMGSCATVSAIANSGTAPYTYSWSNGNTGQSINICPTSTSVYTVTATDNTGATTLSTATVTIPSQISISTSQNAVSCNGGSNGVVGVNVSGGSGAYTYLWNNGKTTSQISNLTSQNYSVTITDALGCNTNTVVSITQPMALSVSSFTSTANCNQSIGTASVNVSGGVGPYSYLWSNGFTTSQISNLTSQNYTVTVTDNNSCTAIKVVAVGNFPGVTAQLNSTQSARCYNACNGIAAISGSGGSIPYSFSWSNGTTVSNPSNLCAGSYTATVTDGVGCYSTVNIIITEPAQLSVIGYQSPVACYGDSTGFASVNVTGGTGLYTYSWNTSALGGSTNQQINNLVAGNYSITITDASGCNTDTIITITEPPVLSYSITTTNETCGQSNGTATIHLAGGTPGYFYFWNQGGNDTAITNQPSGTYTVYAQDNNGCLVQTIATINNTGNPANILKQPNLCMGSTYTLPDGSITSTSGIYSHTLNTGAGCDSIITTQLNIGSPITITQNPGICSGSTYTLPMGTIVSTSGTYKDTLTAIGGCDSIITTQLTVNNIAVHNQVLAPVCDSIQYNTKWYYTTQGVSDTLLNASAAGCDSIINTSITINYSKFNSSSQSICQGSTTIIHGVQQFTAGIYTQNFTSASGCDSISSVNLIVNNTPGTNISPIACNSYVHNSQTYTTSGIYTQTLNTITGCDSILTINLTISNSISTTDTQNICSGQSAIIHGLSQDSSGIYTQTFFATGGCDSTSSVTLFVDNSPIANAGNDTTILAGQTIVLSASGVGEYLWSTGQTTTTINPQLTTTTTYILTVTDNNGCASTDTVTIFIDNPCDDNTEVFVPNSFSPNGDGQNDVLQLYSTGTPETIFFAIYNRWGEKVFECSDLTTSWDGTYRGKPCDTAVFTFVLKITCKGDSSETIRTGNISLLR